MSDDDFVIVLRAESVVRNRPFDEARELARDEMSAAFDDALRKGGEFEKWWKGES